MNLLLLASPGHSVEPFSNILKEQYQLTALDLGNILGNDTAATHPSFLPGVSPDVRTNHDSDNTARNVLLNAFSDDQDGTGLLITGTISNRKYAEQLDALFQSVGQSVRTVLYLDYWIPGSDDIDDTKATKFMDMLDYYDSDTTLRRINAIGNQNDIRNALFAEIDRLR